ncbi:MAG: MOMP family protein [Simkania negevensis]|nr:MOMP family protein [Simkania negevensis]
MNKKTMKKGLIFFSALMTSSIALNAMGMDDRVLQLENQMKQVGTETAMGTFGALTALARPQVDGQGFFITADVLYWHAKIGGTEFGYTDSKPAGVLPIEGDTKCHDFEWNWGFRLGAGYNTEHDGWDVRANYTRFNTGDSESSNPGANAAVVPLRGAARIVQPAVANGLFVTCQSAKSEFDFDYQTVDVELGRAFFISKQLSFRPFAGLKSAWVEQNQHVRYTGGSPVALPGTAFSGLGLDLNTVEVKDDNDFWGMGPRLGFNTTWSLGCGFSLVGNIDGALLVGLFDVVHKEDFSISDNKIKLKSKQHSLVPMVDYKLGVRYDKYFNDNKQHIGVGLGFEAQYWWRLNQALVIDESATLKYSRSSQDTGIYGITLDLKLDF